MQPIPFQRTDHHLQSTVVPRSVMRRRVATEEKCQHLQVEGQGLGNCRRRGWLVLTFSRGHDRIVRERRVSVVGIC